MKIRIETNEGWLRSLLLSLLIFAAGYAFRAYLEPPKACYCAFPKPARIEPPGKSWT